MKAFVAFCRKEFIESLRTYRLIIILAVFVLFGLMNPLVAKLLPDILGGIDTGLGPMEIPEPAAMDSWTQFFKNNGQMGGLALVVVFSGIMANEFARGTLVNILTKGMQRYIVILSKFTVAVVIWTASYGLCFGVTYGYTVYFWGNHPLPDGFLAFVSPWIYGIFLLTLMILAGMLFKNFYGSLLLAGGVVIVLSLINISPAAQKYNPISLGDSTLLLLMEQKTPADFIPALVICIAAIVALAITSILVFNRKQL